MEAGQRTPGGFAFLIQGPRLGSSTKECRPKAKPSARRTCPPRVRRFFGASSVASALDLRPGRDPGANHFTLRCLNLRWSHEAR